MVLPWFSFMALWYKTSDGNCPTTTPPRSPGLVGLLHPCDGMVKNNWEIRMQLTINQGNILYIYIYIYIFTVLYIYIFIHDIMNIVYHNISYNYKLTTKGMHKHVKKLRVRATPVESPWFHRHHPRYRHLATNGADLPTASSWAMPGFGCWRWEI